MSDRPAADGRSHLLCELARRSGRRVLKEHDELLAAEPIERPRVSHDLRETPCDLRDHLVTASVTVLVVDRLEVIDVRDDDRRLAAGDPVSPVPELRDPGMQRRAIEQPGQWVDDDGLTCVLLGRQGP